MSAQPEAEPEATVRIHVLGQDRYRDVAPESAPELGEIQAPQAQDADAGLTSPARPQYLLPPIDPDLLAAQPQLSSILPQCIRVLASNIEGYGHRFEPLFDSRDEELANSAVVLDEKARAETFFAHACSEYSFRELTRRTRIDLSTIGWSGWELLRSRSDGSLQMLEHVPGRALRLGPQSEDYVPVRRRVLAIDGSEWREQIVWRRLRLYAQISRERGVRIQWFKEPGDPRKVDAASGRLIDDGTGHPALMTPEDWGDSSLAHEMLWFAEYDASGPYGFPPWVGTTIAVSGSRKAEETTWLYFENKALPPFVVLVSGGNITPEALKRVEAHFNNTRGVENFHKGIVIDMEPMSTGGNIASLGATSTPKIEIRPLTQFQQGDALFQNYDSANRTKIRSACGIPPVFVGEAQEYSFAAAKVSMDVAERGTFGPSRALVGEQIQTFLMSDLEILYWRFGFRGPNLSNAEDVARLVDVGTKAGVGSPNEYATAIGGALGTEILPRDEPWANLPFPAVQTALTNGGLVIGIDGAMVEGFESDAEARNEIAALAERLINRVVASGGRIG